MDKITMNTEASSVVEKESPLDNVPFWLLTILLVLIPLFIIPSVNVDFLFSKMFLLTIVVYISTIASVLTSIRRGKISILNWKFLSVVALVPVVTIISSFFSVSRPISFIGSGFEFDTAHFITLGFLVVILVATNFQAKQRIFWSYIGILGAFTLVSIFHGIRFFAGPGALNVHNIFSAITSNTVGSWNDIGVFAGLAVILSSITLEFVDIGKKLKWAFYAALVLGLATLTMTNFAVITNIFGFSVQLSVFVGIVALFSFVYIVSRNYRGAKKMPVASLIVLIFCIVMTIGAGSIASSINAKLGITENDILEARPTISQTLTVSKGVVTRSGVIRSILGVGPNRFSVAWAMLKPVSVNQTIFWNTDFNYGSSYLLTTLTTVGILGFLAWILFLVATFLVGLKSVFSTTRDKFSTYLIVSSLLTSLYLWMISLFSTTSPTILVLAFFFTGLLAASLIREKVIKSKEISWVTSQKKGFIAVLLLIVIMVLVITWAFAWSERFIAAMDVRKASTVLTTVDQIPQAENLIASAIRKVPTSDEYLRDFSQLKMIELQSAFQKAGNQQLSTSTSLILLQAIGAAEAAVQINPTDYHNYIFVGQVYQSAGLLGIDRGGDSALDAYKKAYTFTPNSPVGPYLAGYLYALAKDNANAKTALELALKLKPDFQEAVSLYAQLNQGTSVQTGQPAIKTTTSKTTATSTKSTATSSKATTTNVKK